MSWTDNSGGSAGFTIERSDDGGATFNVLDTVDPGTTSYQDTSVSDGVTEVYEVAAYNTTAPAALSTFSSAATAATPLAAPDSFTATAASTQLEVNLRIIPCFFLVPLVAFVFTFHFSPKNAVPTATGIAATTLASVPTLGDRVGDFKLSLSANQHSYRPMEPIAVNVVLASLSRNDWSVWEDGSDTSLQNYHVEIVSLTGPEPGITQWGVLERHVERSSDYKKEVLHPGQRLEDSCSYLNRIYDMTCEGTYCVVVRRRIFAISPGTGSFEIVSNPILIRVISDRATRAKR